MIISLIIIFRKIIKSSWSSSGNYLHANHIRRANDNEIVIISRTKQNPHDPHANDNHRRAFKSKEDQANSASSGSKC